MDLRLISFADFQSIESSRPQSIYTFILSTYAIAHSLAVWWVGALGTNSHSKWQQEKGDSAPGAQPVAFEQTRWPRVGTKEHSRLTWDGVYFLMREQPCRPAGSASNGAQPSQGGAGRRQTDDMGPQLYSRGNGEPQMEFRQKRGMP